MKIALRLVNSDRLVGYVPLKKGMDVKTGVIIEHASLRYQIETINNVAGDHINVSVSEVDVLLVASVDVEKGDIVVLKTGEKKTINGFLYNYDALFFTLEGDTNIKASSIRGIIKK